MAEGVANRMELGRLVPLLATVDAGSFADDQLAELIIETERLLNAVHALSAVALEEFQRRGTWAADGSLSAAAWLAGRSGTPARELRARLRAGAGLRAFPATAVAARTGRLHPRHLDALGRCARRHPELAARDESLLVASAEELDADAFTVVAREWEACADALDSPDPFESATPEPADHLHISRTFDGRYQLDGTFSPETGQLLYAALDAEVDRHLRAARDGDPSVPPLVSQVRAVALVDLVAQTMRREPSDASVPDRYRVAVVVRHDETAGLPAACCDSPAFRLVLGARREVLDVGRLTQQWPAGIRRAITFRDGGCVFPGCDRPPSWCDIHHCQPWEQGGTTSVDNGALLCRRHHTFIHKERWNVAIEHSRPVIRKPDGREHRIDQWTTTSPLTRIG